MKTTYCLTVPCQQTIEAPDWKILREIVLQHMVFCRVCTAQSILLYIEYRIPSAWPASQ